MPISPAAIPFRRPFALFSSSRGWAPLALLRSALNGSAWPPHVGLHGTSQATAPHQWQKTARRSDKRGRRQWRPPRDPRRPRGRHPDEEVINTYDKVTITYGFKAHGLCPEDIIVWPCRGFGCPVEQALHPLHGPCYCDIANSVVGGTRKLRITVVCSVAHLLQAQWCRMSVLMIAARKAERRSDGLGIRSNMVRQTLKSKRKKSRGGLENR